MGANERGSPFLDTVREAIRVRHYSIRTEQAYIQWIKRFIFFHGKKHPNDMSGQEVAIFLTHLATKRNVAANTQNQALNALVFLYTVVLGRPLENIHGVVRAKKPQRLPTVLTQDEVGRLLAELKTRIGYWGAFSTDRACVSSKVCVYASWISTSISRQSLFETGKAAKTGS